MTDTFLTFQKFNDIELAKEIAERLKQNDIEFLLEDNRKFFDPSFANNTFEPDISIKLRPADFAKAHKSLEAYYQKYLDNVDKDYYLFAFSDEELVEIISKPDEWGHFDYQLAQKILRDRGKEIKPEAADLLKTQRIRELAKPGTTDKYWIYFGYFSAIFGGLFGLIIGGTLAYFKKTLPNGETVYAYREEDRNHGIRILLISVVSLIFWVIVRWNL